MAVRNDEIQSYSARTLCLAIANSPDEVLEAIRNDIVDTIRDANRKAYNPMELVQKDDGHLVLCDDGTVLGSIDVNLDCPSGSFTPDGDYYLNEAARLEVILYDLDGNEAEIESIETWDPEIDLIDFTWSSSDFKSALFSAAKFCAS